MQFFDEIQTYGAVCLA